MTGDCTIETLDLQGRYEAGEELGFGPLHEPGVCLQHGLQHQRQAGQQRRSGAQPTHTHTHTQGEGTHIYSHDNTSTSKLTGTGVHTRTHTHTRTHARTHTHTP